MVKKLPFTFLFIAALSLGHEKSYAFLPQAGDFQNSGKATQKTIKQNDPDDKKHNGVYYFKKAELEIKKGYPDKALTYYQAAIDDLRSSGSAAIVGAGGAYINLLNSRNDHKTALSIIAIVESSKKFRNAAKEDQVLYQNAIADTYKATNNDKEAIKAYQNTITIMDSIVDAEKNAAVQKIQAKFQTELQREKNIALETNNMALQRDMKTEKMFMLLYILMSISIIVLILLFLRGYWLRNRLQKEELKSIEAEKDLIQQQHMHEQELTNAQKEIIEEKQRELTSTALRMANYQDSINEIIEKCETNHLTKVSEVKKELQLLMKQKDYWKQFETRFNNLHPEFGNTLTNKFSKLTKNDIEFCSLLKLNLSNKEIASLLQISHESAITKKYRIKKKMEINDDAEFEKLLLEM
jgi:DNA-binding CsgD family transcriptional regulator